MRTYQWQIGEIYFCVLTEFEIFLIFLFFGFDFY